MIRLNGNKRVLQSAGEQATTQGLGTNDAVLLTGAVLLNKFSASLNFSRLHFAPLFAVCLESWTLVSLFPYFLGRIENRRPAFASTAIVVIGRSHCTTTPNHA